MYKEIAKLVIYRSLDEDNILLRLAEICRCYEEGNFKKEDLVTRIYAEINKLLDVATKYGFDENLWHNYLSYIIASNENPFSITCEKIGAIDGTVNQFAKNDFKIFKSLFNYNFSIMEEELGINCFSVVTNYKAVEKKERRYNKNVSEKVRILSKQIDNASNEDEIFEIVTGFYEQYGVGKFGLNKAFRLENTKNGFHLCPITNTEEVYLDDLIGYQLHK